MKRSRRWIVWVNRKSANKICIYGNRSLIQSNLGLLWMHLKQINLIVVPVSLYLTQVCLRILWTQTMLISALTQSQKSNIMDQIEQKDFIFQINLNVFILTRKSFYFLLMLLFIHTLEHFLRTSLNHCIFMNWLNDIIIFNHIHHLHFNFSRYLISTYSG